MKTKDCLYIYFIEEKLKKNVEKEEEEERCLKG